MMLPGGFIFLVLAHADPSLGAAAQAQAVRWLPTYEWLHAHPELSQNEVQTATRLGDALRDIGLEVTSNVGGHGVVGVLRNRRHPAGPSILYRADMDALPVAEQTGLRYSSTSAGIMHACGHDIHMATALGALQLLREHEDSWRGTVLFIGQPAEEVVQGARAMLADSRLATIVAQVGVPSFALALHDQVFPAGMIGVGQGTVTAFVDSVDVLLHGQGGHGSMPDQSVDAVVMGAELVMSLQTIVSRRLPPGTRAVVTVGEFSAGKKRNIIANSAILRLTLRSDDAAVRARLIEEIRHIAQHIAAAYHAPNAPEVTVTAEGIGGVYNNPALATRLLQVFEHALGADHLRPVAAALVGEDFGLFGEAYGCPAVLMSLGAANAEAYAATGGTNFPSLHSERWAPDALPTLHTGIWAMALAIGHLSAP